MKLKYIAVSCLVALLSTGLYAGGNMTKVNAEVEPYVPAPMVKSDQAFYAGLGVSAGQVESHYYGKDTVVGVTGKVGYNLSKYLAVEFRGTKGLKDGSQLGLDYSYGLYLKPQYPVNADLSVYGLLGYAQTKISFDNEVAFNGISNNYTTQNDFSFGVGLDYKLNEDWSLFIDVMRLIDKETTQLEGKYASRVNAITFGFVYHF
jgi:opacity protein-like surface antigen